MNRGLSVILIVTFYCLSACVSDTEVTATDLEGTWEVEAATRNGRTTQTLNGALFDFGAGGSMMTNISGEEDSGAFDLADGVITHYGTMEASYAIDAYEEDTLRLAATLQGMNFTFKLVRTEPE